MTRVRRALDADAEAIREVARRAWHDAYDSLDDDVIAETIEEWYAGPLGSALQGWAGDAPAADVEVTATLLVAERDGDVVGFTQGTTVGTTGTILRLYVDPDHHGTGVGTALYDRLRETFRDHGVERVRALDLATNDASREFFRRHGFEYTDTQTVCIGGEPREEAVYSRSLPPDE